MVLVTGASGLLGRHLVQYLSAQGTPCRALYHAHPPVDDLKSLSGVSWQQADLLDIYDVEEAMKDITHVYHCAAIVSFDPRKREEMLHFNPESTANIVNQALQQDVRMVYVSSVAALGRSGIAERDITEEEEWGESRYNSAYGISKHIAEAEVWRGIGEGLDAVIINPGVIIGDASRHSTIAQLARLVNKQFPFYTSGITSWVDIADVVRTMVLLMDLPIHAERFIISAGNYSYREICSLLATTMGKKPPTLRANAFMAGITWRVHALRKLLTGRASVITRETAISATTVCRYNNSKLLSALPGFAYTPIEQSISAMARSFMNSSKK